MTQLVSYKPWDISAVNLYWYDYYLTGSQLQTTGISFQGQFYQDLFTVQGSDGVDRLELDFLGSGITLDASGNIVSGTVNAILEYDLNTTSVLWYATGLATSAVSIYNAALTPSNQDEINLIQAALVGSDSITGGTGNDILTGYTGNDTLTGGGGNDIFLDTKAGHNGDTITDFQVGDSIVFTDASLAGFTFSLTGNTLTYSDGAMTLSGVGQGQLVASAASGGGVQLLMVQLPHPTHDDFNGDGVTDILWKTDSGYVTEWIGHSYGFSSNVANFAINVGSNWQIAGTGDFNGDGRVDLMWRASDGTVTDWLGQADGSFSNNFANFSINASPNWHVISTGDFNGDGKSDIMWKADDGTVTNWLGQANGGFFNNYANFTIHADPSWHIAATGDFNGDGRDDIIWRSDSGIVTNWLGQADGSFFNNWANFTMTASSSWHIVGRGDFNGDGKTDIIWRADDGTVTDWLGQANGGFFNNFAAFTIHASSDWQIAQTGDFNGDGKTDIMWNGPNGQVSTWLGTSNGGFDAHGWSGNVDPSWHVLNPLI